VVLLCFRVQERVRQARLLLPALGNRETCKAQKREMYNHLNKKHAYNHYQVIEKKTVVLMPLDSGLLLARTLSLKLLERDGFKVLPIPLLHISSYLSLSEISMSEIC